MSILYDLGIGKNKDFVIGESVFNKDTLGKCESIMSMGNGYLALRNSLEEDYAEQKRELFILTNNEPIQLPDITPIEIVLDEELFNLNDFEVLEYERTLNMRNGLSQRIVTVKSRKNKCYNITFEKFVSMKNLNIIVQRVKINPIDAICNLKLSTSVLLSNDTKQYTMKSHIKTGYSKTNIVSPDENISDNVYTMEETIQKSKTFIIEKISEIYHIDDNDKKIIEYENDFDEFLQSSETAWNQKAWQSYDIKIESLEEYDQLALRFSVYHYSIKNIEMDMTSLIIKEDFVKNKSQNYEIFKKLSDENLSADMQVYNDCIYNNNRENIWKFAILWFAGISHINDMIIVTPKLPDVWGSMEFNFNFEETNLKFEITNNVLKIFNKTENKIKAQIFGSDRIISENLVIPYLR